MTFPERLSAADDDDDDDDAAFLNGKITGSAVENNTVGLRYYIVFRL